MAIARHNDNSVPTSLVNSQQEQQSSAESITISAKPRPQRTTQHQHQQPQPQPQPQQPQPNHTSPTMQQQTQTQQPLQQQHAQHAQHQTKPIISPKIATALLASRFRKTRRNSNLSSSKSAASNNSKANVNATEAIKSSLRIGTKKTKNTLTNKKKTTFADQQSQQEQQEQQEQQAQQDIQKAPGISCTTTVTTNASSTTDSAVYGDQSQSHLNTNLNLSAEQQTSISIQNSLNHHAHNLFHKIHPLNQAARKRRNRNEDDDDDDIDDDDDGDMDSHYSATQHLHLKNNKNKPKIVEEFTLLANSVVHRKREDQNTTVRYIAQIDVADFMIKRSKVGTNTSMYVVLEGTQLSVSKTKQSSARYRVNVRVTPVHVDVPKKELRIYIQSAKSLNSASSSTPSPSPSGSTNGNANANTNANTNANANSNSNGKLLRLIIDNVETATKWKEALNNAVSSDITEYYSFGKALGSGAFGEVVQATHNVSNEVRAIKIIKRGDSTKSKEHLDSEIQVMKSISHPNIVQTYQIFDLRRTIYIVMEYVTGGDLFDFVAQHDCLTEKQGSQTMRSIFQAVEYLHCNSIVHRDLKPENILCVNDSWPLQIKVSDFGFAHFLNDEDDTMRTQVGTVYFMAPEIITNKGHGPAVDLWACGVILYTILTGRLPFPGRNTKEYLNNVVQGRILFPTVLWKGISDDAKSLVKGLLNADPQKRLHSLGALQHRWIAWPDAAYGQNRIRRDRSNLHSRQRKLFKARKAIIAVAMANKFKATIPQVIDSVGDQTKKVAGAIETGVKKTTDGFIQVGEGIAEGTKNIGENTKKAAANVADGTKKVTKDIGKGVKKTVGGVENGARKMGHGVKKTADGIETGLKKTADGIGHGVKKTADGIGQGVKKTADGIGQGVKKTADGIGQGVKKTADGLERGVKNTSHAVKRSAEKARHDRSSKGTDGSRSQSQFNTSSQTSSGRRMMGGGAGGGHVPFRRKNGADARKSAEKERDRIRREREDELGIEVNGNGLGHHHHHGKHKHGAEDGGYVSSEGDYQSAIEEHSETEEGWGQLGDENEKFHFDHNDDHFGDNNNININKSNGNHFQDRQTQAQGPPPLLSTAPKKQPLILSRLDLSALGNGIGGGGGTTGVKPSGRPALAPLSGLTMGLSDESMAGSSPREFRGHAGLGTGAGTGADAAGGNGIGQRPAGLGMGFGGFGGFGGMGMGATTMPTVEDENEEGGFGGKEMELLRKTTALMMLTSSNS